MNLRDRLERMGVHRGTIHLKPRPPRRGPPVEDVVAGSFVDTRHGPCFVVEETYASHHVHGQMALSALYDHQPDSLACLGRDEALRDLDYQALAFLDTETTGLAGGTGTYAFLVGVGYFQDQNFHLKQFFMRHYAEEQPMMSLLTGFLAPFKGLVTFNGKAFDVPLLETRFTLSRLDVPLSHFPHLDLLFAARRLWRARLRSCALSSLEEHVLGVERTDDVPSWLVPRLYFDYLQTGDARPLRQVFHHNAQDILSLVTLAARLCQTLAGEAVYGADLYCLGKLYEETGQPEQGLLAYRRALANQLPPAIRQATLERLSFLYKRLGRREEAVAIWHSLLEGHQAPPLYPYVELAKHYEHHVHDYARAAELVQRAMTLVRSWPPHQAQKIRPELEHRLARLERRSKA